MIQAIGGSHHTLLSKNCFYSLKKIERILDGVRPAVHYFMRTLNFKIRIQNKRRHIRTRALLKKYPKISHYILRVIQIVSYIKNFHVSNLYNLLKIVKLIDTRCFGCLISLLSHPTLAINDLGTFGPTWPIAETSLLVVIQEKLQGLEASGDLPKHQQTIQTHTRAALQRPTPVMSVQPTTHPRIVDYNPAITLLEDLNDHRGRLIHAKGTIINPLTHHPLRQPLLFVDGDQPIQQQWVLSQPDAKIILVKGAPFELMKTIDQPVYFDQGGALVEQLGIQQIPARVTQIDDRLQIEELIV